MKNSKSVPVSVTHPHALKHWSIKSRVKPDEATSGSDKKIIWVCDVGHEYPKTIYAAVTQRTKCKYCTNQSILPGFNDLQTTHPELAAEWSHKNHPLTPRNVIAGTNKPKLWWICIEGHEWVATGNSRSRADGSTRNGCPTCSGRLLTGVNDLRTLMPELVDQWNPKNTKGPESYTLGSDDSSVMWVCPKGHEWSTSPYNRTTRKSNCPDCRNNLGAEQRMVQILEEHFGPHLGQRLPFKFGTRNWCRVDYVNEDGLIVEYDGQRWHMGYEDRDTEKTELLLSKGYTIVRLRENELPLLEMESENILQLTVRWDPEYKKLRGTIESQVVPWYNETLRMTKGQ